MLKRKMKGDSMLFFEDEKLILTIDETDQDGGILMTLNGELRSETAHHIQDELDAFTTVGVKVWVDFKEVTFAVPSVFNSLLDTQRRIDLFQKGEVVLQNIPAAIYQEMDKLGITELLMIED